MAKDVVRKLESFRDWAIPVGFILYTAAIAVFPREALMIGGVFLWLAMIYKWLTGGCPV